MEGKNGAYSINYWAFVNYKHWFSKLLPSAKNQEFFSHIRANNAIEITDLKLQKILLK